jgi:MFS transporter, DHA1 family, inner membrane transport protein
VNRLLAIISGYAIAVAVGAIRLTAAVIRFDRRGVLVGLLGLFIAGNLLSTLAPTYALVLSRRVLAALCHGAFFGIGVVVAADIVAPVKRAAAIAMMFAGLTSANVLGVPFGTLLGQQFGWRSTFWAITVVGLVALVGIVALVPVTWPTASSPSLRTELAAFRRSVGAMIGRLSIRNWPRTLGSEAIGSPIHRHDEGHSRERLVGRWDRRGRAHRGGGQRSD